MERYRHTQIGWLTDIFLSIALVGCAFAIAMTLREPNTPPGAKATLAIVTAILAIALLLFWSLTVVVRRDAVELTFGWGPIGKTFMLKDIVSCGRVRNHWSWGWGIRWVPRWWPIGDGFGGWLFNISGLDAVEIEMNNGRVYRIGTDDPAGLEKAIRDALTERGR